MAKNWKNFGIFDEIISVLVEKFNFESPTEVQEKCIPSFLNRKDVIVEAPTGSGKTLAYIIPVLQLLKSIRSKKEGQNDKNLSKWQIQALILVPNRELGLQIHKVVQPFVDKLEITCSMFIGGTKIDVDVKNFEENGGQIIVATPGRLDDLLDHGPFSANFNLKNCFKSLEILILDEADRLFEQTFNKNLTSILEQLPKQRRTGLFSATQTQYEDELCKVGLRNPETIVVKDNGTSGVKFNQLSTPSTLENFYTIVEPFNKFSALCKFIEAHSKQKLLIFMSNCACVDYFGQLLKAKFLPKNKKKRKKVDKKCQKSNFLTILTIHGKKKSKRASIFRRFSEALGSMVLLCTDVMARGIDVPGIDWVLQYDVPRSASFFVHRCGRTARCGSEGKALLFLTPSEFDYVEFLTKNQKVDLKLLNLECDQNFAESLFEKIRNMASKDRSLLLKGTKAFVSYIQSYAKHDCGIVCRLADLDVINTAHAFGLLRLPKMPELNDRDLSGFRRCQINTSSVAFKDKNLEQKRLEAKNEAQGQKGMDDNNGKARKRKFSETRTNDVSESVDNVSLKNDINNDRGPTKRPLKVKKRDRMEKFNAKDYEELDDDYKLIKRLKKGKISKSQFDEKFL